MSELNIDPKIESLKNSTLEFVTHEQENVSEFGGKLLREVEAIVIESVESASTKIDSMLNKLGKVVKTEPFVALAAIAISGLAVANVINRRANQKKSAKPQQGTPPAGEALRH